MEIIGGNTVFVYMLVVSLGIYGTTENATHGFVVAINVFMVILHALLSVAGTRAKLDATPLQLLKQTRATWDLRFASLTSSTRVPQSLSDILKLFAGMC